MKKDVPLAEASGATFLPDGTLLLVSDSGNRGDYVVVKSDGTLVSKGKFPLGPQASDDLEGVAVRAGLVYTLTSSGFVRTFTPQANGFAAHGSGYSLGEAKDGHACKKLTSFNCGPDYEGLCLREQAGSDGCVGYAASRATGKLHCLIENNGQLRISDAQAPPFAAGGRKSLSGCATVPGKKEVWFGVNAVGLNAVGYLPDGLSAPKIEWLGPLGSGNSEAIAVSGDGEIFRFSDLNRRPSQSRRFRCEMR